MNNSTIAQSNEGDALVFAELVESVFLFMHEHYAEFGAILKESEINYTQYVALITVYMHGALSEGDLAKMLFLNPSTVSRMVFALEEKGWVKMSRDSSDRRRVIVELAPGGKSKMGVMRDKQAEVVARQVAGLPRADREYVHRVADQVNKALRLMISAGDAEGGGAAR